MLMIYLSKRETVLCQANSHYRASTSYKLINLLWFNFILSSNLIVFVSGYDSVFERKENKCKPRITLNYSISKVYTSSQLNIILLLNL